MPDLDPIEEANKVADHLIASAASEIKSDDPEKIADQLRRDLTDYPQFAKSIRVALHRLDTRNRE